MKLQITLTHTGRFYKAWLNDSRITEDELYNRSDYKGGDLETHLREFGRMSIYDVELNEIDVS
jgi:hypothetical protein